MSSFPPGTRFKQEYVKPHIFESRREEPRACRGEVKAAPRGTEPWLRQEPNLYRYGLYLLLASVIFHSGDVIVFHFQLQTQSTTSLFNLPRKAR